MTERDPVQAVRDMLDRDGPAKVGKLLDAYAPGAATTAVPKPPPGPVGHFLRPDPIAPGVAPDALTAGDVIARAKAARWLSETLPNPQRPRLVVGLLVPVAGLGLTVGGLVFVTALISGDAAFIAASGAALGLFGVWPSVLLAQESRHAKRSRLVAVEGDTLACYVSDLGRSDKATVSPVWRLPLGEVERLEVGPAADFIAGRPSHYEKTMDVFTVWRGRRVVVHRTDNVVADALTAVRHDLLEMIASAHPSMPAAAPVAAPTPQAEKGFSL